jgi:hypothetical protein
MPHVSLRQAVRPVIVAHRILSDEKLAASPLAEEAKTLLDLTEELLRKLGRVHLLTAGSATLPGEPEQSGMADRLVEAYAQAGISWAKVISSVTNLADLLMDESEWAAVRLITDLMSEAGETAVAKHIESALGEAERARFRAQLAAIPAHPAMTATEVRAAVTGLSSLPSLRERQSAITARRWDLVESVHAIAIKSTVAPAATLSGRLRTGALNGVYPPENELFPGILAVLDLCGA